MAEISTSSTGIFQRVFCNSRIIQKRWFVGMTIGNTKTVDLFAEKHDKRLVIQVKAIYRKKNIGWPISQNNIKPDCFYIFVNLNSDLMIEPEYYICTPLEAAQKLKQYAT